MPGWPGRGRALLLCAGLALGAAAPVDRDGSHADVLMLRAALESLHPGLYRYMTPAQEDAAVAELDRALQAATTPQLAYLALSAFAAKIRCGHTYANPLNQPDATLAMLSGGQDRVPFTFRWLGQRMIVTQDFTPDHALPCGTAILSINGIPAASILSALLPFSRADGGNAARRVANLSVSLAGRYEAFDILFPMVFPQTSPVMRIEASLPDGTGRSADLAALTDSQRAAAFQSRQASGGAPLFSWRYLPDGAAVLGMPSWSLYNSTWDWASWLDARLQEAASRRSPLLVVDLRGNEGGDDVGDRILSHLVTHETTLTQYKPLVRARQVPAALNTYLHTWDNSFRNWGQAARALPAPWPTAPDVPYLALQRDGDNAAGERTIHPAGTVFSGRVAVLTDSSVSSATFLFAQAVQRLHLGVLVGEPTGGNQRGINGGAFFFLVLPHTQLELDLPLIGMFPASAQPDAGLTPDLPVLPTQADIIAGRDPVLARALQ